jgi:DNA-binding HxlR family transcriptional regulator
MKRECGMKSYGQFCPLAQAAQLLCERWTLIVVRELVAGSTRFSDIQRGVPLMSPTLLSARLKHLVKSGVVESNNENGQHSYQLTQSGRELQPLVELLGTWGHRWVQSDLKEEDLDASLLMWDMRRSVNADIFPKHRVVVEFEYPDAASGAGHWWLIAEQGEVDLCLKDPGYEVTILVRCSVKVMTSIWICASTLNDEVKKHQIELLGEPALVNKFQDWLRASALSRLGAQSMHKSYPGTPID